MPFFSLEAFTPIQAKGRRATLMTFFEPTPAQQRGRRAPIISPYLVAGPTTGNAFGPLQVDTDDDESFQTKNNMAV